MSGSSLGLTSLPRNDAYYLDQWLAFYRERDRGLARSGALVLALLCLGGSLTLFPEERQKNHPVLIMAFTVTAIAFWLAFGISWFTFIWRLNSWACPRCGEPFFASTFVRNPFGRRCRHCGLPRPSKAEVRAQSTLM